MQDHQRMQKRLPGRGDDQQHPTFGSVHKRVRTLEARRRPTEQADTEGGQLQMSPEHGNGDCLQPWTQPLDGLSDQTRIQLLQRWNDMQGSSSDAARPFNYHALDGSEKVGT